MYHIFLDDTYTPLQRLYFILGRNASFSFDFNNHTSLWAWWMGRALSPPGDCAYCITHFHRSDFIHHCNHLTVSFEICTQTSFCSASGIRQPCSSYCYLIFHLKAFIYTSPPFIYTSPPTK